MSNAHYYYEKEGEPKGPIPITDLLTQGVRQDTLVWAAGMSTWLAAGQVEELAPLFVAVPPPLPIRTGPPPLPKASAPASPVLAAAASAAPPATRPKRLAPLGYSLPLLGKFKYDNEVFALDSQQHFASFASNDDLKSLHEWGLQPLKKYDFVLLDIAGEPLLTLHKPAESIVNPLRLAEVQVFDMNNQRIGTCRRGTSNVMKMKKLISIEDTQGREGMWLGMEKLTSRDLVLSASNGVVGRVRRSHPAAWTQMLLEHKDDRCEVIFEPQVQGIYKALGISAVVAAYLLTPNL